MRHVRTRTGRSERVVTDEPVEFEKYPVEVRNSGKVPVI